MKKLKYLALASVIAASLSLAFPRQSFAFDAMPAVEWLWSMIQPFMNSLMNSVVSNLTGVYKAGAGAQTAAITDAVTKSTLANTATAQALQQQLLMEQYKRDGVDAYQRFQQPGTTCATTTFANQAGAAHTNTDLLASAGEARVVSGLRGNTNTAAAIASATNATNTSYCSKEEGQAGICTYRGGALAGADSDAAFLFGSASGMTSGGTPSPTYDANQSVAVDSLLHRMVGNIAPEQLPNTGYYTTPQGRAYVELTRRYTSLMTLSSSALNHVRSLHEPQQGLGTAMAPQLNGASISPNASFSEAISKYTDFLFSPAAIQDRATKPKAENMLREIASMQAMQLLMDRSMLEAQQHQEAVEAGQLILMTDQTMGPELAAQRNAAVSAGLARNH